MEVAKAALNVWKSVFPLEDALLFNIPGCVYNRGLYCDVIPYMLISLFFSRGALDPFVVNLIILMVGLAFQSPITAIAHRFESCCSGESVHS